MNPGPATDSGVFALVLRDMEMLAGALVDVDQLREWHALREHRVSPYVLAGMTMVVLVIVRTA